MYTKRFLLRVLPRAETYVSLQNIGSYTIASMMQHMYTCELQHVSKELQSVSTRKGANRWDFAQHGFKYRTINDTIHVY